MTTSIIEDTAVATGVFRGHDPPTSHFSQSPVEITATVVPYVRDGEKLRFMPELMEAEHPYPILIGEWSFFAVKDSDDDILFFYAK